MNMQQAMRGIAALVATADETGGEIVTGVAYATLMGHYSHSDFMGLVGCCTSSGLFTKSGDVLTLTDKGRDAARQLREAIDKAA